MIRDLDDTLSILLTSQAPQGSLLEGAQISFDIPDSEWRGALDQPTVNCYLYDVRHNRELQTQETVLQRSADRRQARRRRAPTRIDCAYCITAWSSADDDAVLDEHRLLSDVLLVLLRNPTIPRPLLQGSLDDLILQPPPFPTVIAAPDGVKNPPEFWTALNQQLKPSLNYILTLAVMLDLPPAEMGNVVELVQVEPRHIEEGP